MGEELRYQDLYLVAFLMAKGHKPTDAVLSGGSVEFAFDGSVEQDVDAYHLGHGEIAALQYADAIRNVKTFCISKVRGSGGHRARP